MAFLETCDNLRQEHAEILRLTENFSDALALAANADFSVRQKGLTDLRTLRPALLGISRHCCCDDGVIETPYHRYLDSQKFEQVDTQHKTIHRLVISFLRELPYATADSIADAAPLGEELAEKIREHIAYEENLLDYIEELCVVST
jgi:Hemerythrin HHE cation binding domain